MVGGSHTWAWVFLIDGILKLGAMQEHGSMSIFVPKFIEDIPRPLEACTHIFHKSSFGREKGPLTARTWYISREAVPWHQSTSILCGHGRIRGGSGVRGAVGHSTPVLTSYIHFGTQYLNGRHPVHPEALGTPNPEKIQVTQGYAPHLPQAPVVFPAKYRYFDYPRRTVYLGGPLGCSYTPGKTAQMILDISGCERTSCTRTNLTVGPTHAAESVVWQ